MITFTETRSSSEKAKDLILFKELVDAGKLKPFIGRRYPFEGRDVQYNKARSDCGLLDSVGVYRVLSTKIKEEGHVSLRYITSTPS